MRAKFSRQLVVALLAVESGCVLLSACHSRPSLAEQYSTRLSPMVGHATKDDVVREYGIPTAKQTFGTTEVWEYRTSKGVQTKGGLLHSAYSREFYEKLTVAFDFAGVLRSWSLETQDGVIGKG
jgi:hypothetical protein